MDTTSYHKFNIKYDTAKLLNDVLLIKNVLQGSAFGAFHLRLASFRDNNAKDFWGWDDFFSDLKAQNMHRFWIKQADSI